MSTLENNEKKAIIKEIARFFTREIKEQCWKRALPVPGRDPERWRQDAVGNVVCKRLAGCDGCLCYEHDHIVPHSKGGLSTLDNCQILQTRVNRYKGNDEQFLEKRERERLALYSCNKKFYDFELDLIEIALWGNVKSAARECRCKSVMELDGSWQVLKNSATMRQFQEMANCE